MAAQNLWRIRVLRMEMQRLEAKIRGLTSEAEAYRLARDCYRILEKYDEARMREKVVRQIFLSPFSPCEKQRRQSSLAASQK